MPGPHPGEQVVTTVHPDFLIDIVQVGLDRRQGNEQLAGNIRIALALDHLEDDLPLPVGDAVSLDKGFGQGVHRERSEWGSDGVAQEIDDQENAIQCVRDGAEQKTALLLRKRECRDAQPPGQVGRGFHIPDRCKDQQADQEVPFLALPGAAQRQDPKPQHERKGGEVPYGGDLVPESKADGTGIHIEHRTGR